MKNIAFVITSAALGCLLFSCGRKETQAHEIQKLDVTYPIVESVTIHQKLPGTIKAYREVKLVARVNGYLRSCNYQYGQHVKKGDILFTIEDQNYRDAVSQAQSNLTTAIANRNYASTRYAAMTEALKSDAVSKMEVEQAKSTLEECEAAIKSAEASLQTAETQLSYCTVRAPFDGHVSAAYSDVGSYLSGEASPAELATIYEDDRMVLYISVDDESTMAAIQQARADGSLNLDSIPLTFSDATKGTYTANLDYMAPSINTSTGTIQLQALIDNTFGELRSGMFATVDLPLNTDSAAILVRDASIGSDQRGKYIYTVSDSNTVVYTPITTGQIYQDTLRIVKSGLPKDCKYITKALLKVRDGLRIDPVLTK